MTPPEAGGGRVIWDEADISRALRRVAHQIIEGNHGAERLILLGIPTRGIQLASRLADIISEAEGVDVPRGELDITMYRDDLRNNPTRPMHRTRIPGTVDDKVVVLVDDVLNSGRTIAGALEALKDLGRPRAIRLAVLVDRGHREVPIQADYVGKDLPTGPDERVRVRLNEIDDRDSVSIVRMSTAAKKEPQHA